MQFTYDADEPVKVASLELVWNNDFIVDDNYGITCKFYPENQQQLNFTLTLKLDQSELQ